MEIAETFQRLKTLDKEEREKIISRFRQIIYEETSLLAIKYGGTTDFYTNEKGLRFPKTNYVIYDWQAISARDEEAEIDQDLDDEQIAGVIQWRKENIKTLFKDIDNKNWKGVGSKIFVDTQIKLYGELSKEVRQVVMFNDFKNLLEIRHWMGSILYDNSTTI